MHPRTGDCTDAQENALMHSCVHPCTENCTDAQDVYIDRARVFKDFNKDFNKDLIKTIDVVVEEKTTTATTGIGFSKKSFEEKEQENRTLTLPSQEQEDDLGKDVIADPQDGFSADEKLLVLNY